MSVLPSKFDIPDPRLTDLGKSQAKSILKNYPHLHNVQCLISSPFRRTLETSIIAFGRNPIPHPGFQENSEKPCDTGSPTSVLREEFPTLDFSLLVDGWNSKKGEWASDEVALANRAAKMRKWLMEREEEEMIVVSHGGDPLY